MISGEVFYCSLEKIFLDRGEVARRGLACNGRKDMSFSSSANLMPRGQPSSVSFLRKKGGSTKGRAMDVSLTMEAVWERNPNVSSFGWRCILIRSQSIQLKVH